MLANVSTNMQIRQVFSGLFENKGFMLHVDKVSIAFFFIFEFIEGCFWFRLARTAAVF